MAAETLVELDLPLVVDGRAYRARVRGRARERKDGSWEGWLEFEDDAGIVRRTERETTQPNRDHLIDWATGLTPVYLEGAFERAWRPRVVVEPAPPEPPRYDEPAGPITVRPIEPPLDPFEVYARGEVPLRKQLLALAPWHLRRIIRAYAMVGDEISIETLDKGELVEIIVAATRASVKEQARA
jgi:hypothetical protein